MKLKNILLVVLNTLFSLVMCSQNIVQNGDFSTHSCTNFLSPFVAGCVNNWNAFSKTPSLFGGTSNPYAWMWSYDGNYEAINTAVSFKEGECYTVSFSLMTTDKNHPNDDIKNLGTVNLRAVNLVNGTIQNEQIIYTNSIGGDYFGNWQTISTTFVASSSFTTLLVNPYSENPSGGGQAEMHIDDIVITTGNINTNFDFENSTGATSTTFFESDTVFLNGNPSTGENKYKISIESRIANSGANFQYEFATNWYTGEVNLIDLTHLIAPYNINFEAGYEYQVTLTLANDCECTKQESLTKTFIVKEDIIDLYVKDSSTDTGVEPNTTTPYFFQSPDIWVTSSPTGTTHQNPNTSSPTWYIRVRVTNRSNTPSTGNEVLHTYWAKASTGLGWPHAWNGSLNNACTNQSTMGEPVASAPMAIPALQPGQSTIVTFPWSNMPDPSDYSCLSPYNWHFCLLTRIVANNDPMTYTEVQSLVSNAKNNNNIAYKNISIIDRNNDPVVTVAVANPFKEPKQFILKSELEDAETGELIKEYKEPEIIIDDHLLEAVEGEIIYNEEEHIVLDNINLNELAFGAITLNFENLLANLKSDKDYNYRLIQLDAKTNEVIGGELFLLTQKVEEDNFYDEEIEIIKTPIEKSLLNGNSSVIYPNPIINASDPFYLSTPYEIEAIELINFSNEKIDVNFNQTNKVVKIAPKQPLTTGIYFVKITKTLGEPEIINLLVK